LTQVKDLICIPSRGFKPVPHLNCVESLIA
jgi:hypothetical protein